MRREGADLRSEGADLIFKRADIRPERANLRLVRAHSRLERIDFKPKPVTQEQYVVSNTYCPATMTVILNEGKQGNSLKGGRATV